MVLDTKGKIIRAKIQLGKNKPFFSFLLSYLDIDEDTTGLNPTISVSQKGNIRYNKKWIDKLTEPEIQGVFCFKGDTMINGDVAKEIKDIKVGDDVFNSQNRLTKVRKIFKRKYNGEMIKIYGRNMMPIEATPEHPIYVIKYNLPIKIKRENKSFKEQIKGLKYEWIKAKNIQKGDILVIPRIKTNKNIKQLSIKKFQSNFEYPKQKHKVIPLNKEIAYLFGIYVADGSYSKRAIQISLNKYKDKIIIKTLKTIVKNNLNKEIKLYCDRVMNPKVINVCINYALLTRAFSEWFGQGAKYKKIPNFIINNNKKIIKSFLKGYEAGDGCYYKARDRIQMATVSKKLAFQLQLLYSKIGILPNLYLYERKGKYHTINGKTLKNLKNYQLVYQLNRKKDNYIVTKDYILTKVRKIEKIYYKGYVYNFETREHTYNTNNIIVHNCHEVMHLALQTMFRKWNRQPDIWNISSDIMINHILKQNGFDLPKDGLIPNNNEIELKEIKYKIKDLDTKSAEIIYDEIYKKFPKLKCYICDGSGKNKKDGKAIGLMDGHIYDGNDKKDKKGKSGDKSEKEWIKRLVEASTFAKLRGDIPKGMERVIGALTNNLVDWKSLLRKYITNSVISDWTWKRPNKRSQVLGTYLPSTQKENIEIVIAIDTSGSIGQEELTQFISEIVHIVRSINNLKAYVIQCDCSIQDEMEIKNGNINKILKMKAKGGGGTNHVPIFSKMEKEKKNIRALICLTDGFTEFPQKKHYSFDTIWVLTKNSCKESNIPFGKVIKMDK